MTRAKKKKVKKLFVCYIPIILCTIVTLFPYYWFLCTSLKEESSIMDLPIKYLPVPFTFDNYKICCPVWDLTSTFLTA